MHQPWRTFSTVINKCISEKSIGLDRLRPSIAQILWGMFYKENVDIVALLPATRKKARKFKKIASPSKKQTLVLEGELAKKPKLTKHPKLAKKSAPAKKDKAPATTNRSKGIELLFDDGANSESEVPDEPKGKSIDTSEGTGLKPGVPDVSKTDSSENENES
ncbi:hypothetical protein Tco_0642883 [Tanacetum coccineum]